MKKGIFCALIILTLAGKSQTNKTWAFGLGLGVHGNSSVFSGGNDVADGRFQHNPFGSGVFEAIARYDHNDHWMFMTGFGFTSYGFEFARTMDYYSLKHEDEIRHNIVRNEFGALEIPAMVFYKFNLNCRNARWLVGAGFAEVFTGEQKSSESVYADQERSASMPPYLKSDAVASSGAFTMLRFAVARERILKRGGILQAGVWINWGFTPIANASVDYTIDGNSFHHEFTNKGDFFGVRASYFFNTRFPK